MIRRLNFIILICSFQIPCITLVGSVVWFGERYIPSVAPSLNQLFDRKTQDTLLTHRNNHLAQKSGMIAKEAQLVNIQVSFHCREDYPIMNVKTRYRLTSYMHNYFFPWWSLFFIFSHLHSKVCGWAVNLDAASKKHSSQMKNQDLSQRASLLLQVSFHECYACYW